MNFFRVQCFFLGFLFSFSLLACLPVYSVEKISQNPETRSIWENFGRICEIPRASRNEGKLAEFIVRKAEALGLAAFNDQTGNVLVKVPATPGREKSPTVVLQSHLDMVCVKVGTSTHDFSKDPIRFRVENGWITSGETTLGADNGVGVAIMLSIMEANARKNFENSGKERSPTHGPLELLFTVDEEGDFSGVLNVSPEWLKGRILLNLDSEEDHEFNIGCAGGQANTLSFPFSPTPIPGDFAIFSVKISGLRGGHSGVDIHRGRGNAIVILSRLLRRFSSIAEIRLIELTGGTVDTAIPNEAEAVIAFPKKNLPGLLLLVHEYQRHSTRTFSVTDPEVRVDFAQISGKGQTPKNGISSDRSREILDAILSFRNGILAMNCDFPGQVQTSENLGVIRTGDDKIGFTVHLQGSCLPVIRELSRETAKLTEKFSGSVEIGEPYSPWEPDPNSRIVQLASKVHLDLFGKEPYKKVVHAGVECGAFRDKFPDMDMISFGPRIENAHTARERCNIDSVNDFWRFLRGLLGKIE